MGKRSRARGQSGKLRAPDADYTDPERGTLTLRGAMTPKTRAAYAEVLHGNVLSQEDAWHRSVEFLFERLVVRWVVADVPTTGSRELLARLRMATQDERRWIRDVLREHLAEHFPDVEAP